MLGDAGLNTPNALAVPFPLEPALAVGMKISSLVPTASLRTFQCSDLDQFRQAFRHVQVKFTPTCATISAEQAVLTLPGCQVYLLHTFPRLIDAAVEKDTTFVGFTMDDGFRVCFNGHDKIKPALAIGQEGAGYKMVEFPGSKFASIIFNPAICNRGWPSSGFFSLVEISRAAEESLRRTVEAAFAFASGAPADFALPGAAAGVQETLLSAIDCALRGCEAPDSRRIVTSHRYFEIAQKIEAMLSENLDRPIYSEDLAGAIGVSVRTLHNVTLRFRGMSLHRYLRLKRLWSVRRELLSGGRQIKTCALANGFWHLGEFAALYAGHFGETPSQTLARARGAPS